MKGVKEIDDALKLISTAKNRWDYEDKQGPLWDAAQKYPKEMIEYYYRNPDYQFSIAWCLAHVKTELTKHFFIQEARNKNQYIRWCAFINLSRYQSKDMIDVFLKGLRDRSTLVKGEALKAVRGLKDQRIKTALIHLVGLKSFKKNNPGYFEEANNLLRQLQKS